jgi:hypothetical protein
MSRRDGCQLKPDQGQTVVLLATCKGWGWDMVPTALKLWSMSPQTLAGACWIYIQAGNHSTGLQGPMTGLRIATSIQPKGLDCRKEARSVATAQPIWAQSHLSCNYPGKALTEWSPESMM